MANKVSDGSVEWLCEELHHLDATLKNGIVTDFHHETHTKVEIDALGSYRSSKKEFYIEITFDY